MARIAYVDHSYHQRTQATMFLVEMLRTRGHVVEIFWDDAWAGGEPIAWNSVANHDVVIMFQSYCPTDGRTFRSLHPNVIYVPMFDQFGLSRGLFGDLSAFWQPFRGSKVLSFSTALNALTRGYGITSFLVHYYPDVPAVQHRATEGLHGFFWLRREMELGWNVVRSLIGPTRFDSVHLHIVGDPGFPAVQPPPPADVETYNITISTWFNKWSDFDIVARGANVYFAPRIEEGIGQAFLEAMSRGQCVVAADNPTMSEYIVHGVNGLLYDPRSPQPLDFSGVDRLGQEARRGILAGRARWSGTAEALVDFILTPSAALYENHDQTSSSPVSRRLRVTNAVRYVSRAARAAVGWNAGE
jgi:Glycosyl transferases group 1